MNADIGHLIWTHPRCKGICDRGGAQGRQCRRTDAGPLAGPAPLPPAEAPADHPPLAELRDLSVRWGSTCVLDRVNLDRSLRERGGALDGLNVGDVSVNERLVVEIDPNRKAWIAVNSSRK